MDWRWWVEKWNGILDATAGIWEAYLVFVVRERTYRGDPLRITSDARPWGLCGCLLRGNILRLTCIGKEDLAGDDWAARIDKDCARTVLKPSSELSSPEVLLNGQRVIIAQS